MARLDGLAYFILFDRNKKWTILNLCDVDMPKEYYSENNIPGIRE